jgi:branched-subunit amino acid ABC-type transport system permease component
MIASFALGLALRMVLQQIFTANPLYVSNYFIEINLDGALLRIIIIAAVLFSTWFFQIMLYKTKYGKIMRAVSDNEDLAKITGIKASRIHNLVWIISAGFAGIAGVLFTSYPVGSPWIQPDVGFTLLLAAFAVAVLGGIGSFEGVVLASLIIGFAENMGVVFLSQLKSLSLTFDIPVIGSSNGIIPILTNFTAELSFEAGYKIALSYLILILVLKIRPYGLLGEKPSGDRL